MSSSINEVKKQNGGIDVMDLSDADLAQAFKELQKGEKTAQMLESNLTNLEKKIDDLLASFEAQESAAQTETKDGPNSNKEEANENGQ